MQNISDELISRAIQGDLDAFESIYKQSASFVYNVALRIVGRKEDAEDIVQEVYMKIYHYLKDFRSDSSFKTWAYRIAVNTALNYTKRSSRNLHESFDEKEEISSLPVQENTSNNFDENLRQDVVENLLSILNPEQKTCIVLRSVQGLSYEEIAQTLNIPINTVRSRIKRARETMIKLKSEVIKHDM